MSEVHSPSTGRRYSIKRVCAVWQIPRSTMHSQLRRSSLTDLPVPRKRGPVGVATDEELVSLIRQVIDASPSTAKDIARSGQSFASKACGHQRIGPAG